MRTLIEIKASPEYGVYIGPDQELRGKTALLRWSPSGLFLLAQFDDTDTGKGYGWHSFGRSEFQIIRWRA